MNELVLKIPATLEYNGNVLPTTIMVVNSPNLPTYSLIVDHGKKSSIISSNTIEECLNLIRLSPEIMEEL